MLVNMHPFPEWCTVYCEQDGKCHTVSVKNLEAEDSEVLCADNIVKGSTVLMKSKGKKYSTTILDVHGKFYIPAPACSWTLQSENT